MTIEALSNRIEPLSDIFDKPGGQTHEERIAWLQEQLEAAIAQSGMQAEIRKEQAQPPENTLPDPALRR